MGRVNRKATLSLKTWCRSPKTVAKRKFHFLLGSTLSVKTWCRSPKTVAKRKFHLPSVNPLAKNVVSIAQNCCKTLHFCVREAGRFTVDRFIHFCARRCSETYILKFENARRCSARHILLLADEPSRRNRCVDRAKL